ncbi:MAG: uroporphyrinogen decarboxylase family protein [Candidatus Bathyarchaeia archaeon]
MNQRERFLRVTHFKEADRAPNVEIGYFDETIERWYNEGLPRNILPVWPDSCVPKHGNFLEDLLYSNKGGEISVTDYFGFDRYMRYRVPVIADQPVPALGPRKIADEGRYEVIVDEWGVKRRHLKGSISMDQYLEFPVKNMQDWEEMKWRFDPNTPERFPSNWSDFVQVYRDRDYPLSMFRIIGFFHFPRYLMGLENLMIAYYKQPELILNMADFWCKFNIQLARKVLKDVNIDWATISEDMAYKGRAMISPQLFRRFMSPFYKRLTSFLIENGVDVIFVDSDGYVHGLIPLWIECGVNGTWPLEINAGNDPIKLRREYPNFILSGGIDKLALAKGPENIEKELYSKLLYLLPQGGYIPSVDHIPPPDISLDNWQYYARLKTKLIHEYPPRKGCAI